MSQHNIPFHGFEVHGSEILTAAWAEMKQDVLWENSGSPGIIINSAERAGLMKELPSGQSVARQMKMDSLREAENPAFIPGEGLEPRDRKSVV